MESYLPRVSVWNIALVFVLAIGIAICEGLLFYGEIRYTIAAYAVLLAVLSLAPLQLEREAPLFQAFALIPVFRLVNFAMPVFGEVSLEWLALIYGPFISVVVYFWWHAFSSDQAATQPITASEPVSNDGGTTRLWRVSQELPWWLGGESGGRFKWSVRKGRQFFSPPKDSVLFSEMSTRASVFHWVTRAFVAVLLPVVFVVVVTALFLGTVYSAELQYNLTDPSPLVPVLDTSQMAQLAVVMIVFVGFVEEFLFRGILQKVLERQLGIILGLLLASAVYGTMYSVYADTTMILYGAGIGLALGILYDLTESLVLVSVLHGVGNVYLYGVIPLRGTTTSDLLQSITEQFQLFVFAWIPELQPLLGL